MSAAVEAARAKINLALHVTGRRADGFHLLDTLAVFADLGDELEAARAARLSFATTGPFAAAVPHQDNLVLRAVKAMSGRGAARPVRLTLTKNIPAAAGLGGGSADAAAALRLLNRRWRRGFDEKKLARTGVKIGADVPMCIYSRALRATGIGEKIAVIDAFPALDLVLLNPGVQLATADVFAALTRRENPPMPKIATFKCAHEVAAFLAGCRNDLETPALSLAPEIAEARAALAAQPGCLMARMTGSGPTLFGIFSGADKARRAAATLAAMKPVWWARAVTAG